MIGNITGLMRNVAYFSYFISVEKSILWVPQCHQVMAATGPVVGGLVRVGNHPCRILT